MRGSSGASGATRPILPRWWVALALMGVGLVAGVLLVGLLDTGRPDFATAAAEQGASSGATSTSQPGDIPIAAEARVNAACLRVINEAQAVTGVLTGVPGATQDVDLQRLDDIVRRLQPLQPRLAQDLRDCRVSAGTSGQSVGPSSRATGVPSASSSATPNPTSSPS